MNFASDNAYGATPEILSALAAAGAAAASSYGADPFTKELGPRMATLFEREVTVFPVLTGTAANALALSTLCPPYGAVLCHAAAHIETDECGAVEFFTHGAKLVPIAGERGKLMPVAIERALRRFRKGDVHSVQPSVISLTQATESGTVYTLTEISEIASLAKAHGLKLHVDGARFANALVHLGASPAEATWKAGVDVLSFGATKNGALCAEAVVFFNRNDVRDFEYRRKKAGHLVSKMRFISAQLVSYLENDRWLATAARANALAKRLAQGLAAIPGAELVHPVEANEIFVKLPDAAIARLRKGGAKFYEWGQSTNGQTLVRLVTSFATPDVDVERFLDAARQEPA
ncbi:MAG TPA: low specificity L-threonine aldolase [Rhizomicrobium sp.]|nr:low specificity L-threonine aldolase [Rhizomicrobium sp.]